MPAEIETAEFCADYWSEFQVQGSADEPYRVSFNGGEGSASCTCPAFKYSHDQPPTCKHITYIFQNGCFWNPQWYDGGTKVERPVALHATPLPGGHCPHCDGPTVAVRIAV